MMYGYMVSPRALLAAISVVLADRPAVTMCGVKSALASIFGGLWSGHLYLVYMAGGDEGEASRVGV
jgi:hypothetical protein